MADLSLGDAAVDAGVPLHVFLSWLHRSGAVVVMPGTEDERCWLVPGFESHVDCRCRFVPVHPDIEPV